MESTITFARLMFSLFVVSFPFYDDAERAVQARPFRLLAKSPGPKQEARGMIGVMSLALPRYPRADAPPASRGHVTRTPAPLLRTILQHIAIASIQKPGSRGWVPGSPVIKRSVLFHSGAD